MISIRNIRLSSPRNPEVVACTACVAGDNKDGKRNDAVFHVELGEEAKPRSSFDLCVNHSTKLRKILKVLEESAGVTLRKG